MSYDTVKTCYVNGIGEVHLLRRLGYDTFHLGFRNNNSRPPRVTMREARLIENGDQRKIEEIVGRYHKRL